MAGAVALPAAARADTVHTINSTTTEYEGNLANTCYPILQFQRRANGANIAQGIIMVDLTATHYTQCVGALYESSNSGVTWHQVSGTHTASTSSFERWSIAPETHWYADGARLLARTCVRAHYLHTDTWSTQVCTTAH